MALCRRCSCPVPTKRRQLGYETCIDCGSPPIQLVVIDVNKSNPVVGTLAELGAASAKGPRTW